MTADRSYRMGIGDPIRDSAEAYVDLVARQTAVFYAVVRGDCTPACAGATKADGACHCACGGNFHGMLWADELDPMGPDTSRDRAVHRLGAVTVALASPRPTEDELRDLVRDVHTEITTKPSQVSEDVMQRVDAACLSFLRGE